MGLLDVLKKKTDLMEVLFVKGTLSAKLKAPGLNTQVCFHCLTTPLSVLTESAGNGHGNGRHFNRGDSKVWQGLRVE